MKRTDRALIVRGPVDPAVVGDFLGIGVNSPALDRLKAAREKMARVEADRAMRLKRPVKDEARANVADDHVARVVAVDGRGLRFGYGIERQVTKGVLPIAALRACEQFRRDWEAANQGGAIAVIDPMRVRVDTSVRNYESPGGRVDAPKAFRAALFHAMDFDTEGRELRAAVAVHCIAEGKTIKTAAALIASHGGDGDPRKVTAMLVGIARRLIEHYDPKPAHERA
jgi:hypothetical protein